MKNRVKSIKYLMFCFVLMLSTFCFLPKINQVYSADENEVQNYYLINNLSLTSTDKIKKSSNVLGSTTGYGKFLLGEENITLTAKATDGYKIVGWFVGERDETNNLTGEIITENQIISVEGQEISYQIEFFDNNSDSNVDYSTFTVSKVYENLFVEPVFDYIYYDILLSNNIEKILAFNDLNVGEDNWKYQSFVTNGNITTYKNVLIPYGDYYKYFDNLVFDSTTSKYYTTHTNQADELNQDENIDYTVGAYRLNQNVEVDLQINWETNCVVDSVSKLTITGEILEQVSSIITSLDDLTGRTQNLSFYCNVSGNDRFSVKCHYLYKANFTYFLDGVLIDSLTEENTQILSDLRSTLTISNAIKRDDLDSYFIVNPYYNENRNLNVVFNENFAKHLDKDYIYYNFEKIIVNDIEKYEKNTVYTEFDIEQDLNFQVYFKSQEYTVTFVFAEKQNEFVEQDIGLTFTKKLTRGEKDYLPTYNQDTEIVEGFDIVGYKFIKCVSNLDLINQDYNTEGLKEYGIDKEKPEDIKIYYCYEKINYTIKIIGFNLLDSVNELKPINQIQIAKDATSPDVFEVATLNTLEISSVADSSIVLGNVYELFAFSNTGFQFLGFKLENNLGEIDADFTTKITINENIINDYVQDIDGKKIIVVHLYEDYLTYTATFEFKNQAGEVEQPTLMADLTVELNGKAYIEISKYTIDGVETTNDSLTAKIVISSIRYNDLIGFTSKGKTTTEQNREYTYMFNYFTKTGLSVLDCSASEESIPSYTYFENITKDVSIYVYYSLPTTKLGLAISYNIENAEELGAVAINLTNVVIKKDGEDISVGQDGLYQLEVEKNYTISFDQASVNFGYLFNSYILKVGENSQTLASSNGSCNFTPTRSAIYTLVLNFDIKEYKFIVSQYGDGLNGAKVNFGENEFVNLSVINRELSFTKHVGHYISKFEFVKDGIASEFVDAVYETNNDKFDADKVRKYSHTFSTEDMRNVVMNYLENGELNIHIYYSAYKYELSLTFSILQAEDYDGVLPIVDLVYNGVTATKQENGKLIIFKDIPYNSRANFIFYDSYPTGLKFANWIYGDTTNDSQDINIIFNEYMATDYTCVMKFVNYKININANSTQGVPTIENVYTSQVVSNVTLYSNFKIIPNATKSNGYKFRSISYLKPNFTEYDYDEASWNINYSKLYYKLNNQFIKNSQSSYDANLQYFIYSEQEVRLYAIDLNDLSYIETNFNTLNYALNMDDYKDYYIEFNIDYELIKISIVNNSHDNNTINGEQGLLDKSDLDGNPLDEHAVSIKREQYASYLVEAVQNGSQTRVVNANDTVDINDQVRIIIQINQSAIDQFSNNTYDLSLGLNLVKDYISFNFAQPDDSFKDISEVMNLFNFEQISKGKYSLTYNIRDIINYISGSAELLELKYVYSIDNITITASTNINKDEFYNTTNGTTLIISKADSYGGGRSMNRGSKTVNNKSMFSTYAEFSYNLRDGYSNSYRIKQAKVFLVDGQTETEIDKNDYENYGIVVNSYLDETTQLNLIGRIQIRYLYNIRIELQCEPIIYYNGKETQGDFTFEKPFKYNNLGEGQANLLTKGDVLSGSDISADNLVSDVMQIEYYQDGNKIENPTNVGLYEVKISFVGEDSLLNGLVLPYKVYLNILKQNIYLVASTAVVVMQKTYDGIGYNLGIDSLRQYVNITDGKDLNINYISNDCKFILNNLSAQVENNNKNASDTPYNVVVSTSLKLNEFNNNFKLENTSIIIEKLLKIEKKEITISNVNVYDKVYDMSTNANLKNVNEIRFNSLVGNEQLAIDLTVGEVYAQFDNAEIGRNHTVTVDVSKAVVGDNETVKANYIIKPVELNGVSIYPYSVSVNVAGFGTISLFNDRGKVDPSKADLIPIDAKLTVNVIYPDSQEYSQLYRYFSNLVSNQNRFAIAYKIQLSENGSKIDIPKGLYLSLPSVARLKNVVCIGDSSSANMRFEYKGDNVVFDLEQFDKNVETIALIQQTQILKVWQIVLIILITLILITIIVIILIIIRNKKNKIYKDLEKI